MRCQNGVDGGSYCRKVCRVLKIVQLTKPKLAAINGVKECFVGPIVCEVVRNAGFNAHRFNGLSATSAETSARITGSLMRSRNTIPLGPKRPSLRVVTRTLSPNVPSES